MEDKKPLIFLNPLSESLQKLKEVMSESAETDGIEIFEADSIEEMGQLLPNIGQSVVLTSNPKKCALMLQTNRKVIRALQSKVILLSPKTIPYRTLEKFMKIGLTECIVEPVAPKTLLYKVNLFIRSIANKKAGGEMNSKFGLEGKDQPEEELEQKVREKKTRVDGTEEIEEAVIDNKKPVEETEELVPKKKKSNFEEAPIEGYYKGKSKKREDVESLDEESDDKKGYQEEDIDSYYKGDLKGSADVIDEDMISKRDRLPTEEEILEEIKKKVKVSIEEDLTKEEQKKVKELEEAIKEKKKKARLEIDQDSSEHGEIREKEVEDLGGHYKGKVSKGLNVEDDEEDFVDEKEEFDEELGELKNKIKLEVEEDHSPEDYIDEEEASEDSVEKKKKAKLNIVNDEEEKDFVDKKEDEESEEDDGPSIKLDVINDEDKINRDKLTDDEEEQDEKKAKVKLKVQQDHEAGEEDEAGDLDDDNSDAKKPKVKLTVEKDNSADYTDKAPDEEEAEDFGKKKTKLNVQQDNSNDRDLDKEKNEEEDDQLRNRRVEKTVKEEKERDKTEAWQEDLGGDLKRKSGESFKEEKNQKSNRADARADRIKTHYSSKESIKHNDDDWGNKWKKGEKQEEEWKGPKEELALIIEKDDLGEQTIDYKSLKEQFEGIAIDGIRNGKKKYGILSEKKAETQMVPKTIYHEDGTTEVVMVEEVIGEEEEEKKQKIYEPKPVGLDVAIEVLALYMIKESKSQDVMNKIGEKLWKLHQAQTAFYFFDKTKGKYDEVYSTYLNIETIKDSPDYEEARAEWKILKDVEFNSWQFVKLPFWSDTTFRNQKIQFVYPFFEGVNSMGFAVVSFTNGMTEEVSKTIEMILETARGHYLDRTHELSGNRKNYGQKKDKKKEEVKGESKAKGFLKKMFGWAS